MDNFEGKLIEEVQKYQHIYDSSMKEYRDSIRVQNSWQEIARNLNVEIELAKKKWKYIRESYVKSKKTAKGKSGDGRPTKPNKYFELLAWLSPFIKHRPTESNIASPSDTELTGSMDNEDPNSLEEELSLSASLRSISPVANTTDPSTSSSTGRKVIRKRPRTEVEKAIMQSLADKEDEDEFANFGKTIADSLRKLPKLSQVLTKKKINDIIFEAEMAVMGNNPNSEANEEPQVSNFMDFLRN